MNNRIININGSAAQLTQQLLQQLNAQGSANTAAANHLINITPITHYVLIKFLASIKVIAIRNKVFAAIRQHLNIKSNLSLWRATMRQIRFDALNEFLIQLTMMPVELAIARLVDALSMEIFNLSRSNFMKDDNTTAMKLIKQLLHIHHERLEFVWRKWDIKLTKKYKGLAETDIAIDPIKIKYLYEEDDDMSLSEASSSYSNKKTYRPKMREKEEELSLLPPRNRAAQQSPQPQSFANSSASMFVVKFKAVTSTTAKEATEHSDALSRNTDSSRSMSGWF